VQAVRVLRFLFEVTPGGNNLDEPFHGSFVYVLFLRYAQGDETQLVQGLLPAAGEGVQGIFWIQVPPHTPLLRRGEVLR
jgi:hypothetical protein